MLLVPLGLANQSRTDALAAFDMDLNYYKATIMRSQLVINCREREIARFDQRAEEIGRQCFF